MGKINCFHRTERDFPITRERPLDGNATRGKHEHRSVFMGLAIMSSSVICRNDKSLLSRLVNLANAQIAFQMRNVCNSSVNFNALEWSGLEVHQLTSIPRWPPRRSVYSSTVSQRQLKSSITGKVRNVERFMNAVNFIISLQSRHKATRADKVAYMLRRVKFDRLEPYSAMKSQCCNDTARFKVNEPDFV